VQYWLICSVTKTCTVYTHTTHNRYIQTDRQAHIHSCTLTYTLHTYLLIDVRTGLRACIIIREYMYACTHSYTHAHANLNAKLKVDNKMPCVGHSNDLISSNWIVCFQIHWLLLATRSSRTSICRSRRPLFLIQVCNSFPHFSFRTGLLSRQFLEVAFLSGLIIV